MKRSSWLAAPLILSLLCGCGYSTRSVNLSGFKTISVEPFKNKVIFTTERTRNNYFPLLEVKARNAIVDRFLFDGNLKVVDSDVADVVLKGDLVGYERDALRYTDNNDVLEYRIHIVVSLVLWSPSQNKVIWAEPSFVGETTYFPIGAQAKPEAVALEDALVDLGRRVVERTVENW